MIDSTDNAKGPERIWTLAYNCEDEPDAIAIGYAETFFGAHEYIRADLAPAPAPAVKVRALVWQRHGDHHAGGYGYVIRKMGSRYTLTVRNNYSQNFDTIEAAKAAAQAHHEATILAALDRCGAGSKRGYANAMEAERKLHEDHIKELEAKLVKAVEKFAALEKAASDVARRGAETGPQWTKLTIALLAARATLAEIKGGNDAKSNL